MKIENLTYQDRAGQRLLLGFDGTNLNDDLKFIIDSLRVGGIILFARNIESKDQLINLCFSAQEYAKKSGLLPLFIAIDQEGGIVARLKKPHFQEFKGMPYIQNKEELIEFGTLCSNELNEIGVNMNMSPVLDIANEEIDSIMKERAFSSSPSKVADFGVELIKTFIKNNIIPVAKHFPGIGRSILDSHLTLPIIDIDFNTLNNFELVPFKSAIKSKVPAIMLSHLLYSKLDEKYPASLSTNIVKEILRKDLNYNGLVMTDDLDMKAIKFDIQTCIKQIIKSDIDIVLICHKNQNRELAFNEMLRHIKENPESDLKSLDRISSLKKVLL